MSGWIDRFDKEIVTASEIRLLDHRHQVAWAYYGVAAVVSRMSEYFIQASGIGLALRVAEMFFFDNVIDGENIAAARNQLFRSFEQLEHDGYDRPEFEMAAFLITAIQKESHSSTVTTRHTACNAACGQSAVACDWCHSSAGVAYTQVVQWLRGVGACKLSDELLDEIMSQFFQFGRQLYTVLTTKPPTILPRGKLPGLDLLWEISLPIEEEMLRTAWKPPPVRERLVSSN